MAEIKLKPCPHCGSEATIAIHPIYTLVGRTVKLYTVECMNFRCPNPDPTSICYLTKEDAAEAWNHRKDGEDDEHTD
jgi:hypothetical protein